MKFIKVQHIRGIDHNHGTKYVVVDLKRSSGLIDYQAGTSRKPRKDSKYWGWRYMVYDTIQKCQIVSK